MRLSLSACSFGNSTHLLNRPDDILAQHEVVEIQVWNQHSLRPGQPARLADVKEALYLLVHAACGQR